jgi:hypothetical protein
MAGVLDGVVMSRALRRVMPVVAMAAVLLAGAGPAGAAGRAAQATTTLAVTNHLISGTETSISCLTLTRCEAVGQSTRGVAQVVSLYNGRQARVTDLKWQAALTSVSCPNKSGCWAIGPFGNGFLGPTAVLVVKIGPTGKVVSAIKIGVPTGDTLSQIGCRTMTACQILGTNFDPPNSQSNDLIFFSPWNGKRWRLDSYGITDNGTAGSGFSCWQTTCVMVGWEEFNSVQGAAFAWTFHNGVAGAINFGPVRNNTAPGHQTVFNAVSCVSSSTCFTVGYNPAGAMAIAISDSVPSTTNEPMPFVGYAIACVRVTCWVTGGTEYVSGNEVMTLKAGVVTGTTLTDPATTAFAGITSHGNGFMAIGSANTSGESDVVIG